MIQSRGLNAPKVCAVHSSGLETQVTRPVAGHVAVHVLGDRSEDKDVRTPGAVTSRLLCRCRAAIASGRDRLQWLGLHVLVPWPLGDGNGSKASQDRFKQRGRRRADCQGIQ